MKKINKTIRIAVMTAFCLIILTGVMLSRAAAPDKNELFADCVGQILGMSSDVRLSGIWPPGMEAAYNKKFAEMGGRDAPYADWNKSPATIIGDYHEKINEKFNNYIQKMIVNGNKCEGVTDPKSACVINKSSPPRQKDGSIICPPENFSTYCVAQTLYNDPAIGYKTLRDIMTCRKYEMFETAKDGDLYFSGKWLMSKDASQEVNKIYQEQKAITVGVKMQVIEDKLLQAKKAMDQTLAAYDQLRIAWEMHKTYIQIYKKLIKYRDLLKQIRRAVEIFPAKFIDASSTKCV
jgi:hypothetical protein